MGSKSRTVELVERLARAVANEGHAHGLKPAQWDTLRYLSRANRFSRTPGALTSYLGSTKGTVSQTVMTLERAGLVAKTANPGDGRSVRLALTAAGATLLEQDGIAKLRQAADGLPDDVRSGLEAGLDELLARQLAANGGRPFGVCDSCRHFARDAEGAGKHFCALLRQSLTQSDAGQICYEQQPA